MIQKPFVINIYKRLRENSLYFSENGRKSHKRILLMACRAFIHFRSVHTDTYTYEIIYIERRYLYLCDVMGVRKRFIW